MNTQNFVLIGESPLLLHSGELANPLNPYTRQINRRKKKGRGLKEEAEIMAIARLEFEGGFYTNGKGEPSPIIPAKVIFTVLRNGARLFKKGKSIESGVVVTGDFEIQYEGPRDIEGLWNAKDDFDRQKFVDLRMVGVQRSKVLRARPIFRDWELPIEFMVDPQIVEPTDIREFLAAAGQKHGIGDGRSLGYGRFSIQ